MKWCFDVNITQFACSSRVRNNIDVEKLVCSARAAERSPHSTSVSPRGPCQIRGERNSYIVHVTFGVDSNNVRYDSALDDTLRVAWCVQSPTKTLRPFCVLSVDNQWHVCVKYLWISTVKRSHHRHTFVIGRQSCTLCVLISNKELSRLLFHLHTTF